jgi:DNA-directed RNA polymerase alpha subunit
MIDLFDKERKSGRWTGYDFIAQEAKQFKRLQHLSDHDVAFRMAVDLNTVRKMRAARNQINRPLYNTGIDYGVRVLLGKHNITTTGELFALSDDDILAIPKIGKARLEHIREKLREFFS